MTGSAPLISHIHHFALDDGPGIRTTVFFKGCPLSCVWCHNPESIKPEQEITFHAQACIGCGACLDACPNNAITMNSDQRIIRERCSACGACAEACPSTALRMAGRSYSVEALTEIIMRDRLFYETSGGGVTLSGGEATLYTDYVSTLLQALKKNGIHCTLQTSGFFDLTSFKEKLLPYIDLIYYDIKIMDPVKHAAMTGQNNRIILDNFTALTRICKERILPRVPLIPGITDTHDNLSTITAFLKKAGYATFESLRYNQGGEEKEKPSDFVS